MRIPFILAACLASTACVQTLAPTVVSGPMPAPAASVASAPGPASEPVAPSSDRVALSAVGVLATHDLVIPVAGADPDHMQDSFDAGRDGGREHHAIDILAPRGTPVLAADDGHILRLSSNTLGGLTIYTVDPTGGFVYYYAHLDGYRDGLHAGDRVAKGDTIGYVGTTGNAPKNLPHLHFQILRMPADGKYWNGEPIDPYPLLSEHGTRLVGNR